MILNLFLVSCLLIENIIGLLIDKCWGALLITSGITWIFSFGSFPEESIEFAPSPKRVVDIILKLLYWILTGMIVFSISERNGEGLAAVSIAFMTLTILDLILVHAPYKLRPNRKEREDSNAAYEHIKNKKFTFLSFGKKNNSIPFEYSYKKLCGVARATIVLFGILYSAPWIGRSISALPVWSQLIIGLFLGTFSLVNFISVYKSESVRKAFLFMSYVIAYLFPNLLFFAAYFSEYCPVLDSYAIPFVMRLFGFSFFCWMYVSFSSLSRKISTRIRNYAGLSN